MISTKAKVEKLLKDSYKHPVVVVFSGVANIGKNSYLVFLNGRVLIIDFGVGFPDIDAYNINVILPDLDFIELIKDKIDGVVLTHAHLDHVGGIEYLVNLLEGNVKIFGSRFTIEFVNNKLRRSKYKKNVMTKVVTSGSSVKTGQFKLHFAHVTHSILHSMMVAVDTEYGKIVYTGDYKFDDTPINERPTDTHIIRKWADSGILVSLLDSTNAFETGHSKSETTIMGVLEEIIQKSEGRTIIGMFSSLVSRMIGIIEIAKRLNKKVAFTGRSMEENIKIARKIGYLVADRDVIIPLNDIDKYDRKQVVILATGSQGEHMAALTRMARGKHEKVKLTSTDTVILSASVIPTNVVTVQGLMDLLSFTGVKIINSELMDVHVSGHAYQEEMIEMAKLLQSKYYIPVHGYPSYLFQHKRLLIENNIPANKIFVPSLGGVFVFPQGKLEVRKKVNVNDKYVINNKLVSANDTLIEDRITMAKNGVCTVCITQNQRVFVTCRAVVLREYTEALTKDITKLVSELISSFKKQKVSLKDKKFTSTLYTAISRHIKEKYGATPVVVVNNKSKKFYKTNRTNRSKNKEQKTDVKHSQSHTMTFKKLFRKSK